MCARVGVYCLYHSVCTGITGVCFCSVVCVAVSVPLCVLLLLVLWTVVSAAAAASVAVIPPS